MASLWLPPITMRDSLSPGPTGWILFQLVFQAPTTATARATAVPLSLRAMCRGAWCQKR